MYPNPIKQKLADGQVVFGTGLAAFSPHIAGPTLDTGIDFLWIDTEHMPYGAEALDTIPVLARQRGVAHRVTAVFNDDGLARVTAHERQCLGEDARLGEPFNALFLDFFAHAIRILQVVRKAVFKLVS